MHRKEIQFLLVSNYFTYVIINGSATVPVSTNYTIRIPFETVTEHREFTIWFDPLLNIIFHTHWKNQMLCYFWSHYENWRESHEIRNDHTCFKLASVRSIMEYCHAYVGQTDERKIQIQLESIQKYIVIYTLRMTEKRRWVISLTALWNVAVIFWVNRA